MPFYILLAMQAAGMITDFLGASNQDEMMKLGMKLQQAGIDANLKQTQAESQEESLRGMIELRKTIGSQIAVMAARGTSTAGGSAVSLLNESVANYNADERVRRLNLLGRENQMRAQSVMSRLQYSSDSSKLWQSFGQRTFNRFPSSLSGWKQGFADASEAWGDTKKYFGYGLTTKA